MVTGQPALGGDKSLCGPLLHTGMSYGGRGVGGYTRPQKGPSLDGLHCWRSWGGLVHSYISFIGGIPGPPGGGLTATCAGGGGGGGRRGAWKDNEFC